MGRKCHASAGVHSANQKKHKVQRRAKSGFKEAESADATIAFAKIVSGRMQQLTEDEVRELFRTMDIDDSGAITTKELQKCLEKHIEDKEIKKDLLDLLVTADVSLDGTIDAEEFRQALLLGSHADIEKMASKMHGMPTEDWVLRETLVEYLDTLEEQKENCKSLPSTLLFFIIFFYLVVSHLDISLGHDLSMAIGGNLVSSKLKDNYPGSLWNIIAEHAGSSRISRHNQVIGGLRLTRPAENVPAGTSGRLCPYGKFSWFVDFLSAGGNLEYKPIDTCYWHTEGSTSWVHWPLDVDTAMERFAIGVVNTSNATDINGTNVTDSSNGTTSDAAAPAALAGWRRLAEISMAQKMVAAEYHDPQTLFPGLKEMEHALRRLKAGGGGGGSGNDGMDSFFADGDGVPDSSKPVWALAGDRLTLTILTYNVYKNWYTYMSLAFALEDSGGVSLLQTVESFKAQPIWLDMSKDIELGRAQVMGLDIVFLVLFLVSAFSELSEMIYKIFHLGCRRGFKMYISVWNIIDWMNIFMVITIIIVYFHSNYLVAGLNIMRDRLPDLDENRRYTLEELTNSTGGIEGYETAVETLAEQAERVVWAYADLRWYITVFTLCSTLKFFKAFRANPRLDVVTQTVVRASSDLAHFLIVFFALLMAFVLVAHILFGSQVKQFHTSTEALNTCFLILLGYAFDDISYAMFQSGKLLGIIWAWVFNILMVLVLLNMVLAIIFDVYADIKTEAGDSPSLWAQTMEVFADRRRKRKKLKEIQAELDKDKNLMALAKSSLTLGEDPEYQSIKVQDADEENKIVEESQIVEFDEEQEPDPEAKPDGKPEDEPQEEALVEDKPRKVKSDDDIMLGGSPSLKVEKILKSKWSEAKLLDALKVEEKHDKSVVTLQSLMKAVDGGGSDEAMLKMILDAALEHSKGKEEELTSMGFIDAIRLVGRIDANVRDVLRKMRPDQGKSDSIQELDEKINLAGPDLEGRFRRIEDAVAGLTHKLQMTIGPAPPGPPPKAAAPPPALKEPLPPPGALEVLEA